MLHCNPNEDKTISFSELNTIPLTSDGPVRLRWLAALLRLCDEVDNQASRTVPHWLRGKKDFTWRGLITDIIFDLPGECIKLRTPSIGDTYGWDAKSIDYFKIALENINKVLASDWRIPLQEMGMHYTEAFCEVMLPAPAIISKDNITVDQEMNKPAVKNINFEPSLEARPIFSQVKDAILRLDNAVIRTGNEQFFSWDVLAEEAGIGDIELVRLAASRIASMSECKKMNWIQEKDDDTKVLVVPGLICSDQGWRVMHDEISHNDEPYRNAQNIQRPGKFEDADNLISTGLGILDQLLYPEGKELKERTKKKKGGFYFPYHDGENLAPIIAIHGTTGIGKSTLALQIAINVIAAKENSADRWTSVYYSLELQPRNLLQHLKGYRYFQKDNGGQLISEDIINLEKNAWHKLEAGVNGLSNKLLIPRLTKNPSNLSANLLFERKFEELKQAVDWLVSKKYRPFLIIDSLTALIGQPLTRNQIDRLFTFFRSKTTPLIVTLETHHHWASQEEETIYDASRFLADIVIALNAEEKERYYKQTLEVQKTRYNRRILGKHLLKLKSPYQTATRGFDNRIGIVVYPSIDHHLVGSRDILVAQNGNEKIATVGTIKLEIPHRVLPLGSATNDNDSNQDIASNTCIAISGPMGGHKFAVGINILLATDTLIKCKKGEPNTLILSLSEEREIRLKGVALLENLNAMNPSREKLDLKYPSSRDSNPATASSGPLPGAKVFEQTGDYIMQINFRLGKIMPEEFLYILERYLHKHPTIRNILFTDTSHLRTRFPLLNDEPLFIPAMIDIIKSRNIFSVFIDVTEKGQPTQSLLAAADCRVMVEKDDDKYWMNTIRIDNVRCKDYDRNPRIIEVVKVDSRQNYCLEIKEKEKQTAQLGSRS